MLGPRLDSGPFLSSFDAVELESGERCVVSVTLGAIDAAELARLADRARLVAELAHPCVAAVSEVARSPEGLGYVVEDVLDGETLERGLARRALTSRDALPALAVLTDVLAAARDRGLVGSAVRAASVVLSPRPSGVVVPHVRAASLVAEDPSPAPPGDVWSLGRAIADVLDAEAAGSGERAMATPLDPSSSFLASLVEATSARDPLARPTMQEIHASIVAFHARMLAGESGRRLATEEPPRRRRP